MRKPRIAIINGRVFTVPLKIARHQTNSGWYVNGSGRKYFGDQTHGGTENSFIAAVQYLHELLNAYPRNQAPGLKTRITRRKSSDLPVGIYGPYWTPRVSLPDFCYFQISYPVIDAGQYTMIQVYIGTEKDWAIHHDTALEKALSIRQKGIEKYFEDLMRTNINRAEVVDYKRSTYLKQQAEQLREIGSFSSRTHKPVLAR